MLARRQRLHRHRDITAVVRRGRTFAGRLLVLQALSSPGQPTRFVIVVSKQVAKRAVVRNRVKRQLRAVLADLAPAIRPGISLLVRVRPAALNQPTPTLHQEIQRLLGRSRIL